MSEVSRALVPVVTVPVRREGRQWVAAVGADGVWTQARTLDQVRERARSAIALARDIDPDLLAVTVRVDSPEMDALVEAREQVRCALAAAVVRLRSQAVPWPETARALGINQRQARDAWDAAVTGAAPQDPPEPADTPATARSSARPTSGT